MISKIYYYFQLLDNKTLMNKKLLLSFIVFQKHHQHSLQFSRNCGAIIMHFMPHWRICIKTLQTFATNVMSIAERGYRGLSVLFWEQFKMSKKQAFIFLEQVDERARVYNIDRDGFYHSTGAVRELEREILPTVVCCK